MTRNKVMAIINPSISLDEEIRLAKQLMDNYPITFLTYKDVKELFPALTSNTCTIDYVAVDLEALHHIPNADVFSVLNTLDTLITCGNLISSERAKIVILVGATTPFELIKEIMGLPTVSYIGLRGGDGFTYEEVGASLAAILAEDNTVPQQVISRLAKRRKAGKNSNSINLTPRQRQIFNLVANRGASNKVIAKMLNISESTVKLHMGALLKKYKVRNRTQLAVFAKDNTNNTSPPLL